MIKEFSSSTKSKRGGRREGSGRKKGVPNKVTATIKKAAIEAFDEIGGKDYLVKIAREDPKTFIQLLSRILPSEIRAETDAYVDQTNSYIFNMIYQDPVEEDSA